MATNSRSKDQFLAHFQKKFGKDGQINAEQAWRLINKYYKKWKESDRNDAGRDQSEDSSSDDENKRKNDRNRDSGKSDRRCSSGRDRHLDHDRRKHGKHGRKHKQRSSSSSSGSSKS